MQVNLLAAVQQLRDDGQVRVIDGMVHHAPLLLAAPHAEVEQLVLCLRHLAAQL